MKRVLILLTALCFASSSFGDEPQSYDFAKINQTIATALQDLVDQTENINELEYAFIAEQTDVAAGKYALKYKLDLANVVWSQEGVRSEGEVRYTIAPTQEESNAINVAVDLSVETDTLALLKSKIKRGDTCKATDSLVGLQEVLLSRHCEFVGKLADVTTVGELHAFVQSKLQSHREDVEQYNAVISEYVAAKSPAGEVGRVLDHEIKMSENTLAFLEAVVITETPDGFTMQAPAFKECPFFASQGLELDISAQKILAKGDVTIKFGGKMFTAALPTIKKILTDLEAGEKYTEKLIQLDMEMFVDLINMGE